MEETRVWEVRRAIGNHNEFIDIHLFWKKKDGVQYLLDRVKNEVDAGNAKVKDYCYRTTFSSGGYIELNQTEIR